MRLKNEKCGKMLAEASRVLKTPFANGELTVEFDADGGGFPSTVHLNEEDGGRTLFIKNDRPPLKLTLLGNKVAFPFIHRKTTVTRYRPEDTEAERVEFNNLGWMTAAGEILPDFKMSLRHEFWPDGTMFSSAFLTAITNSPPEIEGLDLTAAPVMENFGTPRWSVLPRPMKNVDATFIQALGVSRFIEPERSFSFARQIVPAFSFACPKQETTGLHMEFFVEGQNSLSGHADDTQTSVSWSGSKAPVMKWNFQKTPFKSARRPLQWGNQWGWLVARPPGRRRFPPLKTYHLVDKRDICPDRRLSDKIVASSPDLLILHDPWRLDPKNGGAPRDPERFKYLVTKARDNGVMTAVYVRGNEMSGAEESFDWFGSLKPEGVGGLYMDYGGPVAKSLPPDEAFPGGRVPFRRHFMELRACRKRIGPEGILLSHTGPFFSAVGMTGGTVDCHVSGEGEDGVLTKGRTEHEFFSASMATTGSVWTAAFPEYSTRKIIPFLAVTGQAPHVPLGRQYGSSSLSHYQEPGSNDTHIRPLWKLWGLFRRERDIFVFNDYNRHGVLTHRTPETGGYLMVSKDRGLALLILANFSASARVVRTDVNWRQTGFIPSSACWKLAPSEKTPGRPTTQKNTDIFSAKAGGLSVIGWMLARDMIRARKLLEEYSRPYPKPDKTDMRHLAKIMRQKRFRETPFSSARCFLRVEIPEAFPMALEDSLHWDLFDNEIELGVFKNGAFTRLGWMGKTGFHKSAPPKGKRLMPGDVSDPTPLHKILPEGRHMVGLRVTRGEKNFHAFAQILLSSKKDGSPDRIIEFMNEVEPDRAFIRWDVFVKK